MSSVYNLFTKSVELYSEKTAIVDGSNRWSYEELNHIVNMVASEMHDRGLKTGDMVAIFHLPSMEFIASMFACFKLGITYTPLDVKYPDKYLKDILDNTSITYMLTSQKLETRALLLSQNAIVTPSHKEITINKSLTGSAFGGYIIFTSGSTGGPKGVVVQQESLFLLLESTRKLFNFCEDDTVPLYHSISFDFSIWEICIALSNGGSLVIVPHEYKFLFDMYANFLIENKVSVINLTPSMFYRFISYLKGAPVDLIEAMPVRLIILGGEALNFKRLRPYFDLPIAKKSLIFNMYGITEGTIHSTYLALTEDMLNESASLIGRPLPGVEIVCVTDTGSIAEHGQAGNLYLGGKSIAKEYLNDTETTNNNFTCVSFPGKKSNRWFKTGDIIAVRSTGIIEYIGRQSGFVKIKGYRLHTKEIENVLLLANEVEEVIVLSYNFRHDEPRIVAFVKGSSSIDTDFLLNHCKLHLPYFKVPSRVLIIESFPLNLNGKYDMVRLRKMAKLKHNKTSSGIDTQEKIVLGWQRALGLKTIKTDQNFFDAGGDSLLLLNLQEELQNLLGIEIELITLIEYPTVKSFYLFLLNNNLNDSSHLN